ncbi:sulfotransferase [Desulfonatronum sp. SC1]|uniref:sulfotransferase family protein n=1 Tax=Desulfonatronum sp. SC1 TaxID=2109626 RepID=UPI000D31B82F|nr:sulfotransferase [Desulfonatronum sp. SC1]PTN38076.1 hypothetical protein C6366_04225 [Desulfonatronum sp. SC1]
MIKFKSKYSPYMQVSATSWIKNFIKTCYFSISDPFVKPIEIKTNPVFVVGCGHSGTTLLTTLISRHTSFFPIGYESGIFLPKNGLYTSKNVVKCWDFLSKQYNKNFFIEKTPKHCLCIKRIFRLTPNAKILYTVRDGRDNILSLKKRLLNLDNSIERWIIDNEPAKDWIFHNQIHIVRFENIINDTAYTIREICDFLKIDFDDSMLYSTYTPYKNNDNSNMALRAEQTRKPIYNSTNTWQDGLSKSELDIFWKRSKDMMVSLGYM